MAEVIWSLSPEKLLKLTRILKKLETNAKFDQKIVEIQDNNMLKTLPLTQKTIRQLILKPRKLFIG